MASKYRTTSDLESSELSGGADLDSSELSDMPGPLAQQVVIQVKSPRLERGSEEKLHGKARSVLSFETLDRPIHQSLTNK